MTHARTHARTHTHGANYNLPPASRVGDKKVLNTTGDNIWIFSYFIFSFENLLVSNK